MDKAYKSEVGNNMASEVDREATGHGAAGKLTGPAVVPRQEQ
jgi:hypothetical protein